MGIWLADAMKIDPFSRAKLIAGRDGIDKMVVATNIQEVPNVDRWLYGGEILFTSGYAFGTVRDACELMKRINKKGVAAMVVKPGQYLEKIPQEMINCANNINLPLFEMPENMPYMDCIVPIEACIANEHAFVLERTEHSRDMLLQQIVEGKGLEGICDVLFHIVWKPVIIMDNEGAILAEKKGSETEDLYLEKLNTNFTEYLKKHGTNRLIQNKYNRITIKKDYYVICIPVSAEKEVLSYIIIDSNYDEIQNTELLVFENASSLIAVQILQERALLKKEADMSAQLLDDILKRKYDDTLIIQRRCKYAGFDSESCFCICVISVDDFETWMNEDFNMSIDESMIQRIKQNISEIVQEEFNREKHQTLSMVAGVGVIVMCSITNSTDKDYCYLTCKKILTRLSDIYPKLSFSAGIGRMKNDIKNASDSLREAKLARKAGKKINTNLQDRVSTFNNLSSLCFLNELSGSEEMHRFYQENVGKIIEYDKKNGTELIRTLDTYFRNNRNLRLTSEELFIHKNSVIYRIRKIEGILGKSLDDYETSFNLMLCMRIRFII